MHDPDVPPARIMFASDLSATQADALIQILVDDGHQVEVCRDGADLPAQFAEQPSELLVLDLDLHGADALLVCRQIRALSQVPIITLGPNACEESGIASFEAGADGHVRIPCRPGELALRVRSLLRLARFASSDVPGTGGLLVDGELRVDLSARQVRLGPAAVTLTSREFDLLTYLMRHPRRALSREQLLAAVWNWTYGDASTVTVHVRRLRAKLEGDQAAPRRIVTVRGVGYRYEPFELRSGPRSLQLGRLAALSRVQFSAFNTGISA